MTAVIFVGLLVAAAFVLAITWIEPRVLATPAASDDRGAQAVRPVPALEARTNDGDTIPARKAA
jgi:hypothetical protein